MNSKNIKDSKTVTAIVILSLIIFAMIAQISHHYVVIKLARSPCFGSCPEYQVTINGDGIVYWKGVGDVKFVGEAISKINAQQVGELIDEFDKTNFLLMRDYDTYQVTDHPSAWISIELFGISKTVTHYYGDYSALVNYMNLNAKLMKSPIPTNGLVVRKLFAGSGSRSWLNSEFQNTML